MRGGVILDQYIQLIEGRCGLGQYNYMNLVLGYRNIGITTTLADFYSAVGYE